MSIVTNTEGLLSRKRVFSERGSMKQLIQKPKNSIFGESK